MRISNLFELILLLLVLASIMLANASDCTLGIFGNANLDDVIDEADVEYLREIIQGTSESTELADANYDGTIDENDIEQIELIIHGDENELTIIDAENKAVTVQKPIQRIVTGYNDIAEMLRILDAEDRIVGIDPWVKSDKVFFSDLCELPEAGHFRTPNYEAILGLSPDVYMPWVNPRSPQSCGLSKEEGTENLFGVQILCLNIGDPDEMPNSALKLGYILDQENEAKEFVDWYQSHLEMIESRVCSISNESKPNVYLEFWSDYQASNFVKMCDRAGGTNIADTLPFSGTIPHVDGEWLLDTNPDVIIKYATPSADVCGYSIDDQSGLIAIRENILNRTELANVNAVTNGSVYVLDMWHMGWGPSTLISTAYMAKIFYPDLFSDLDPQAIHQEYLTRFQGLDYNLNEHGAFIYPKLEESK
jgi:iron complex transport system substrate-binding protein